MQTGLLGLARGCRNLLGFKEFSFINFFVGGRHCEKFYLCVCVLVAMVAFVGCATTGGGAGGSAGGSKSKLSEADL